MKLKNATGTLNKYAIITIKGNQYYSIDGIVELDDSEDIDFLIERGYFPIEAVKKKKANKGDK